MTGCGPFASIRPSPTGPPSNLPGMTTPPPAYAVAAGAAATVRDAADTGSVSLEPESGAALAVAIDAARARVEALREVAEVELGRPLDFGAGWVGRLVSERIRGAATGAEDSAGTVLAQFAVVLDELALAVREAAEQTVATDEDAADRLRGVE